MIIHERLEWEPVERYYFRSTDGATPICTVTKSSEVWLVMFDRGPSNNGPYIYHRFETAKRQVSRFLRAHEDALAGPPIAGSIATFDHLIPSPSREILQTTHPRRRHRRRGPM